MEWQPIETAPKDGTVVLVWYNNGIKDHSPLSSHVRKAAWIDDAEFWQIDGVGGNIEHIPTHWMPLPNPPEVGQ